MTGWFKTTTHRQLTYLVLLLIGASLFPYLLDIHPRVNISIEMLILGVFGAIVCLFTVAALKTLLLLIFGEKFETGLRLDIDQKKQSSVYQILGKAIVEGTGEELFFRSAVFYSLLRFGPYPALFSHGLIIFLLSIDKRSKFFWPLICSLESTVFAVMYLENKSYFMICISHFLTSLFWATTLRTSFANQAIEKTLNFRQKISKKNL